MAEKCRSAHLLVSSLDAPLVDVGAPFELGLDVGALL